MCGRLIQTSPVEIVRAAFRATGPHAGAAELPPRYNVPPSLPLLSVVGTPDGRRLGHLRWGLVPSFAEDPDRGPRSINARAETLAEKRPFRELLGRRRCIVPADGFYEWKVEGARKTPYFVRGHEGRILPFAGLWDRWKSPGGEERLTCAIVTCAANDLVGEIHDRMPVVLDDEALDHWLDPTVDDPETLLDRLRPCPEDRLEGWPVSRDVNSPKNDAPSLIQPIAPAVSLRLTPRPRRA